MPQDTRTLYEILRITRNAKSHEIERAYRRIRAEMQKETAAPDPRLAALVQNAYEVLSDPARREAYDESIGPDGLRAMRRAQASQRVRIGVAVGGIVVAGLVAYFALRPEQRVRPPDPRDIAQAATMAVGRVQGIDVAGAVTPLGLAFAIQEGALATACTGIEPTSQLVVSFAQRKVPARVATIYTEDQVCRLHADNTGSWPLPLAPILPRGGERIHATRLAASGQVELIDGTVSRVTKSENGTMTIEVTGPAASQVAGGPLLDAQGRVLGVGEGGGRYRPVPKAWIAEMNLPPPQESAPPEPEQPKAEPKAPIELEAEKAAHERAEKLRYLENLK